MLIALAVTLAIHLSLAAGVIWGGWLETDATGAPAQPREVLVLVNLSVPVPEPGKIIEKNSFVPVDLKTVTPVPPKENTPIYSNSQAAQEKPTRTEQPRPFIDDQNDLFPNSFNQPPALLNPAPTAAQTPQPQKTSPNPAATVPAEPVSEPPRTDEFATLKEPLKPVDVLGKPIPLETNTTLLDPPRAPKRRSEVDIKDSQKIKSDGGDSRKGSPSPGLRLTGYGDYDARFVDKVRQAWLRYRAKPGWFDPGKVVIDFKLHHNGAITDLVVRGSSAKPLQDYYGRQALMVSAPFTKWSETMRREIGADFRQCQFLFHYLPR